MKKRKAVIVRPLDVVLSAPSHIAILRVLKDVREGLSGREVARRAGINHQTCADSLTRLESRGVIKRLGSGKTQLFRLNRENNLVKTVLKPMLESERKQFLDMQEDFSRIVNGYCLSAIIFGSVARREETPASDFDIALIVKNRNQKIHGIIRTLIIQGTERWGIQVSPIVLTLTEFNQRASKKDPLINNILREGITIYGKQPQGLLK